MATVFQWSGRTTKGLIESGEMTAATREEVISQLRKEILLPLLLQKRQEKGIGKFSLGGKVKDKDIVVFTRQFATMIDAGLPLVQALEILSTQVENKSFSSTFSRSR